MPPGPVKVKVEWSVSDCFMDSVGLSVDGSPVGMVAGNPVPDTCVFTWDATNAPLGSRPRLLAYAFYSYLSEAVIVDRRDSVAMTVRVDTGGPELWIVAPAEGDTFNRGTVPIKVWARDTSVGGMSRVEFFVDDALTDSDSFPERDTWRSFWDAAQAAGGNHIIKARAYNLYDETALEQVTIAIRDTTHGGGPTYHHGYIDTSETWLPAGNPHIVDADVVFRNGAWLTVQPGCVVRFDNFNLYFGLFGPSGLTALGSVSAPILFTSNQASPQPGDWTGFQFGESTLVGTRLSYCTIEYAGYTGYEGAAINILNGGKVTEIDNCIIRQSGRHGVFCRDGSEFLTFRNNTITSGLGYPLRIGPKLAERLADNNTLVGNDSTGVELFGSLVTSATWPALDVPYVVHSVTVGDTTTEPVLTIAPGAEVRFKRAGSLYAGNSGATIKGRIIADGTGGRITFTSLAPAPASGDFLGVRVNGASAESEFRNCDFSFGGGTSGDNGMLYAYACNPTIVGNDFGYSGTWGIMFRTAQAPDTLALRQQNTFHNNASGDIKWVRPFDGR